MTDLGPIEEDVRFGWSAATKLSRDLRSAATGYDSQIPHRDAIAERAKHDWRGAYAGKFDGRIEICTGDAKRIAHALRDAADKLDELAVLAREEQDRRALARKWKVEHDAWRKREDHKGMFESFTDSIGITDYDEPVCPVGAPKTPPHHTISAPTAQPREQ